jgi:hypothetical protein
MNEGELCQVCERKKSESIEQIPRGSVTYSELRVKNKDRQIMKGNTEEHVKRIALFRTAFVHSFVH